MSRTSTVLLENFLYAYKNPKVYYTQELILQLNNEYDIIGTIVGLTGPTGPVGDRYSSITTVPVLINPLLGNVSIQVGNNLAYKYGTPVYVSSAGTYTNNFLGTVLYYNLLTGDMAIGNISAIHGIFTTPTTYTVNAPELISIGDEGPPGLGGYGGPAGLKGPVGVTGPSVPFSGGTSALITFFQYGFDCGDVD